MKTNLELNASIRSLMFTLGTLSLETSVIQNDMHKIMLELLHDELKYGGVFRHHLWAYKHKLKDLVNRFVYEVDLLTKEDVSEGS